MNRQVKMLAAVVVLVVLVVSLLGNAACTARERKEELAPVRYREGWMVETCNVATWAALEEGYFAEEGIEVLITPGTSQEEATPLVAAGEYDIVTSSAVPALMGIAEGMPIKVVAMIHQHNYMGLIALESSGIRTPQDIEGRRVKVSPQGESYGMWKRFVEVNDLDMSTITEVVGPFGYEFLLAGEVDLQATNMFDGPTVVEKATGEPVVVFSLKDYPGIDRYTNCLVVNSKFAQEHPDRVRAFVKAFLRGMVFVMETPDKAADHLLAHAGERELDEEIIRTACTSPTLGDYYVSEDTEEHGLGHMTAERWQEEIRRLVEERVLNEEIPVEDIFTNEYLPDPPIFAP